MPPRPRSPASLRALDEPIAEVRAYRNSRLYRSLTRTLRVYNRLLVERLHARGFTDFAPAFPSMLSNLDTNGTRIGGLAARAGVTRQAAGQLLREIERCGYVLLRASEEDGRVTTVRFTARGRRLLATVLELVDEIESAFAAGLAAGEFDRVREGLLAIADSVDPGGALGTGDAPAAAPRATAASRESRHAAEPPVRKHSVRRNSPP